MADELDSSVGPESSGSEGYETPDEEFSELQQDTSLLSPKPHSTDSSDLSTDSEGSDSPPDDDGAVTLSSKPSIRELRQLPVTNLWYNLGLQLKVSQEELERIQSKYRDEKLCRTKMFGVWRREDDNPSYEKLLQALAAVGRRDLVESICKQKDLPTDSDDASYPHNQAQVTVPKHAAAVATVSGTRLHDSDVPQLLTILCNHAYNWNEIGIALGFTTPELRCIGSKLALALSNPPTSFFQELLNDWVHWPNKEHNVLPTVEALEAALRSPLVGLGTVSESLRTQLLKQKSSKRFQKQPAECVRKYFEFLKSKYHDSGVPLMPPGEWPPNRGRQYSDLTIVEKVRDILPDQESVEERSKALRQGEVKVSENERVIKSLDDVLVQESNKPLKVLVEGVPGVGKSTLVRKSFQDWVGGKSLQQFHLVVLATLRKQGIRLATSVEDLLEADDPDLNKEVARHLQKASGEGVLFIFDGYDELNEEEQDFFLKIIQGELLHKCSVVLTSRSYAVEDVKYEEWIHRHVEILGFTEHQMEDYFLQNVTDSSVAAALAQSLREEASLSSIGYTPLNCSILLYIFQQENQKLPNTLTELFSAFILSLLRRHVEKTNDKRLVKRLKNAPEPWIRHLPEPHMKDRFTAQCKLAYDGLIKGKFIFSSKDITEAFGGACEGDMEANLLSLMTSTTSFSSFGEKTHYQFLHGTVQEFLAANWITDQPACQIEKLLSCKSVKSLRMKTVLCFFAGISELKKENLILKRFLVGAKSKMFGITSRDHASDQDPDVDSALTEPVPAIVTRITFMQRDSHGRKVLTYVNKQQEKQFKQRNSTWLQAFRGDVKEGSRGETSHRFISPTEVPVNTRILINIALMLNEVKNSSLYNDIMHHVSQFFEDYTIKMGHFKLSTVDCIALAKFLSSCPCSVKSLRFDFCKLTRESMKIFHKKSHEKLHLTQYNEVQLNYCSPCFSLALSLIPQIAWFQHTKVLCLHGLKYPRNGELQLHSLLQLSELTDLTLTVEGIPKNCLSDFEKLSFLKFVETLLKNKTLQSLTYHQSPSAASCESFVQLMTALSYNTGVSLSLGDTKIVTKNSVTIPNTLCFKLCSFGLASAMKLVNARGSESLQILNRSQNLLLPCHSCQIAMGMKAPVIKPHVKYDKDNQAVKSYSIDFSTYSECGYLKAFQDTSPTTAKQYCSEFHVERCLPSLSSMLYIFPQIPWFQHIKVLCLGGLQYPIGLSPEAFQLHSLLTLKTLAELTVTIKQIPEYHLSDCEVVFVRFTEALQENTTLRRLTYDQCPSAATCRSFTQLMMALSHNTRVSLAFGSGSSEQLLITTKKNSQRTVNIPNNICFKVCYKGMANALKLAEERRIENLKLDHFDVFSLCKTCNIPSESESSTPLSKCDYLEDLSRSIFTALAENKALISLDISGCQVTDEVAQCIAAGLAENRTLKELSMSFHSLTIESVAHILKSLKQSKTLETLSLIDIVLKLSYNPTYCLAISDKATTAESSTVEKILQALLTVTVEELAIEDTGLAQSKAARLALEKLLKFNRTIRSFHFGLRGSKDAIFVKLAPQTNYKNVSLKVIFRHNQSDSENYCYYSAVDAMYIFQSIQSNTWSSLEELNMTLCGYNVEVYMSGRGSETVGLAVSSLLSHSQRLKTLHLRWCRLDDVFASHIGTALAKNQSLKTLNLNCNSIKLTGAAKIFQSLTISNTTLEHLDLSHNGLNQQMTRLEPSELDKVVEKLLTFNTSLRFLVLSSCGLDFRITARIAAGLARNCKLEVLNLSGNRITSRGAVRIFEVLQHGTSLKELDLSDNQFEMDVSQESQFGNALKTMLISCQTLTKLGLSSCRIGPPVLCKLAAGLANNHSLKILHLSDNDIIAFGAVEIFNSLQCNTSLEELDLSKNDIVHGQFGQRALANRTDEAVEKTLTCNQTLRKLELSQCKLDELFASYIRSGLQKNHSLKVLDLSSNNITRQIVASSETLQIIFSEES